MSKLPFATPPKKGCLSLLATTSTIRSRQRSLKGSILEVNMSQKSLIKINLNGRSSTRGAPNGGHNKVMSEHSNDTLIGDVTIAPNVNLGDMKKLIEDIEGIPVSKTTIHRTLSELDFICGKPSEKPPVSPQIIEKRKHYCDMHQSDKFANVLF